ncbi:MAG TPA: vitamin K epoxide reductase family protein [Anaerolineales bacterium]|nr:vitamin K epoxide reductase family protein [Anaerolineales bacterium]
MKSKLDQYIHYASLAVILIGLVVSVYMAIYNYTDNDSMCLGSGDCSTVNASRFSEFYGIPVGLIGVFGYIALFLMLYYEDKFSITQKNGNLPFFASSLLGFLFTIYLIYIEIWILDAICPFCLVSQITMTILFFVAVYKVFKNI